MTTEDQLFALLGIGMRSYRQLDMDTGHTLVILRCGVETVGEKTVYVREGDWKADVGTRKCAVDSMYKACELEGWFK